MYHGFNVRSQKAIQVDTCFDAIVIFSAMDGRKVLFVLVSQAGGNETI